MPGTTGLSPPTPSPSFPRPSRESNPRVPYGVRFLPIPFSGSRGDLWPQPRPLLYYLFVHLCVQTGDVCPDPFFTLHNRRNTHHPSPHSNLLPGLSFHPSYSSTLPYHPRSRGCRVRIPSLSGPPLTHRPPHLPTRVLHHRPDGFLWTPGPSPTLSPRPDSTSFHSGLSTDNLNRYTSRTSRIGPFVPIRRVQSPFLLPSSPTLCDTAPQPPGSHPCRLPGRTGSENRDCPSSLTVGPLSTPLTGTTVDSLCVRTHVPFPSRSSPTSGTFPLPLLTSPSKVLPPPPYP